MPTYQYRCTECGNELEAVQRFTDPSLTECPECTGQLRKKFNAVGVVFRGSGFYRTDSRDSGSSSTEKKSPEKTSTEKTSTEKTSSGSSTETSGSKQPVAAGSSSGSSKGSSTAA